MPRENSEMQKARKRQMGRWGLQVEMEEGLSRRRSIEAKRVEKRKTRVDKRREDLEG